MHEMQRFCHEIASVNAGLKFGAKMPSFIMLSVILLNVIMHFWV